VLEAQARTGDEVAHRAGDDRLAGRRLGCDARSDMHGDAGHVVSGQNRFRRCGYRCARRCRAVAPHPQSRQHSALRELARRTGTNWSPMSYNPETGSFYVPGTVRTSAFARVPSQYSVGLRYTNGTQAAPIESPMSSHLTLRWREMDSNFQYAGAVNLLSAL